MGCLKIRKDNVLANDKRATGFAVKSKTAKSCEERCPFFFFFSFRRMAIKPLPVLVAIRRKLPFGKLKKLA